MNIELREIPPHIQRTFLELRSNQSHQDALEWLINEFNIGREMGELPDNAEYRKGLQDMVLWIASLTGLRFEQTIQPDIEQRNNETDEDDTDGA